MHLFSIVLPPRDDRAVAVELAIIGGCVLAYLLLRMKKA